MRAAVQGLGGHHPRGDEGQIAALAQGGPAADDEIAALGEDHRHLGAAEADKDRPMEGRRRPDRRGRLRPVGGAQHRHVGQRPHDGQILHRLVGAAVLPDGDPAVGGHHLDVHLRVGQRLADLLEGPPGGENGEGGGEGDHPPGRQTGRHADHVGLGDPGVEKALGKLPREEARLGRAGQVGVEHHNLGVFPAQFDQRLAVGVPCSNHFRHYL